MQFLYRFLILIVILCNSSCTGFYKTKPKFNSILQDSDFQVALKGHTIQVVAPASSADPKKIIALKSLKNLNIKMPENLVSDDILFHSNNDKERFLLLKKALESNKKNEIIWCLRGGYGSARIIPELMTTSIPLKNKLFIGFSDITALHLFLSQQWGWKTIYGSALVDILNPNKDPKNFQKLGDLIAKKTTELKLEQLQPMNDLALKSKKVFGRLTGGNLSIVQTSIGTNWEIKSAGKILFLEETGEKGYQIDRSLNQLKQAGVFKKVKAIVFGEFFECREDYLVALKRFSSEINIPVFQTNQFGHGQVNYPIVYNSKAKIVPSGSEEKIFTLTMDLKY